MPQADAWHIGQADLPRGHDAAVAGNDAAVGIDQHRVGEAEFAHAGGELRHLRLGVRAAVARVGNELINGERFDLHGLWGSLG